MLIRLTVEPCSRLTVDVFVPLPQQQRSQQQQDQANADTAHDQSRVVRFLSQSHRTQGSDGVRLTPLGGGREGRCYGCQLNLTGTAGK